MSRRIWTSAAALAASGLALSACSTFVKSKPAPPAPTLTQALPLAAPPPAAPPVVVKVPVPVKEACVPRGFARAPKYPDSDTALRDAGGAADRYQLMAAGRLLRERRLADLEKIVEACR